MVSYHFLPFLIYFVSKTLKHQSKLIDFLSRDVKIAITLDFKKSRLSFHQSFGSG